MLQIEHDGDDDLVVLLVLSTNAALSRLAEHAMIQIKIGFKMEDNVDTTSNKIRIVKKLKKVIAFSFLLVSVDVVVAD